MTEADIDLSMPPIATAVAVPAGYHVPGGANASAVTVPTTAADGLYYNARSNDNPVLRPDQIEQLTAQGFPHGLAAELGRARSVYPVRFWVADNSGSMQTSDGHELRTHSASNIQVVPCTRWVELQGSLTYHIQLAGLLEATTVFRMLNDPGQTVGKQELTVGDASAGASSTVATQVNQALDVIRRSSPRGVTPLTQHLEEIRMHLMTMEATLREKGQEAVVVLATDGLPSNQYGESTDSVLQQFLIALKALQSLPVWIVIRLCTDDDKVVDYYNNLDQQLELPLEVIDDFFGEAKEIHQANKWLTYGLPLHRCREMGYHHRIFDLLDERLLNKDELLEFVQLVFGPSYQWSDPHSQWKEFVTQLEKVLKTEAKQFNPISHKMEPWIDLKQLKKAYSGGGGGFRLFGKKK